MAGAGNAATISLRLLTTQFSQGIRQAAGQMRTLGQGIADDLRKPIADGLREGLKQGMKGMEGVSNGVAGPGPNSVKTSLKDKLMPTMQQVAGVAATVGSALSLGAAAQTAIGLRDAYQQVAFKLERLKGTSVDWTEVQGQVETAAEKTSRRVDELTEAYDAMLQQGASAEFAGEGLVTAGHLMNATKMSAAETGQAIAALAGKFNISAKDSMAAAEMFAVATGKGQMSMEESMQDLRDFGSTAKIAGWSGMDGFRKMMGVVAIAGQSVNSTTSEVQAGLDVVNDKLRDVGLLESLLKETNPELKLDKDAWSSLENTTERLKMLAEQGPKAMRAFRQQMTGREEIAISDALMKPYFDELNAAKERGLSDSDAAKAAKDKLAEHLNNLGSDIQANGSLLEQSAKVQSGASAKIQKAMNKWMEAISNEKILAAIDKLIERLPELAELLAKAVDWAADNPMLAGAAVLGIGGLGGGALLTPFGGGGGGAAESPVAATVTHAGGSALGGIATAVTAAVAKNVINHIFKRGAPAAPTPPPMPPVPGPGGGGGCCGGSGGSGGGSGSGMSRDADMAIRALVLYETFKASYSVGQQIDEAFVAPATRQAEADSSAANDAIRAAKDMLLTPERYSRQELEQAAATVTRRANEATKDTFANRYNDLVGGALYTVGAMDIKDTTQYRRQVTADEAASVASKLYEAAAAKQVDAASAQTRAAEQNTAAINRLAAALDRPGGPGRSGNATPGAAPR